MEVRVTITGILTPWLPGGFSEGYALLKKLEEQIEQTSVYAA